MKTQKKNPSKMLPSNIANTLAAHTPFESEVGQYSKKFRDIVEAFNTSNYAFPIKLPESHGHLGDLAQYELESELSEKINIIRHKNML